ncbi:MAG: DUF3786 domain-containing protein [Pseudomonadota bacterium]
MSTNYEKILRENLNRIHKRAREELQASLPATAGDEGFLFRAFAEDCAIGSDRITFSGRADNGPKGLLISLYGAKASRLEMKIEPFKSFKDFPGSMPYHGAFSANTERVLIPHVGRIKDRVAVIIESFGGELNPPGAAGDFACLLTPLPKVALCYIFYLPDEEFPASVTCLFSANAEAFMPLDGLADIAEYTSKRIIQLLE